MLDSIIQAVQQVAGQSVAENPNVPAEQQGAVASEAVSSITGGIQKAIAGGNVQSLINLFSGNEAPENNATVQNISGNFVSSLTEKLGFGGGQASALSSIIPMIFNLVKSKLGQSTTSAGGNGLESILSGFSGILDQNKDGKVDLSDAAGLLKGGGLLDSLKGLFGGK